MNKMVKKTISIFMIFTIFCAMFNGNVASASDMKSDAKKLALEL